jgi:hypothetical protein
MQKHVGQHRQPIAGIEADGDGELRIGVAHRDQGVVHQRRLEHPRRQAAHPQKHQDVGGDQAEHDHRE